MITAAIATNSRYRASVCRGRLLQEYGPAAALSAPQASRSRSWGSPSSADRALCSAPASPGGTRRAAPAAATSPKPPTSLRHDRLAERERGREHARDVEPLGPRVRQHDDVSAAEQRRQLAVGDEPRHEPDVRRRARPRAARSASAAGRRSTARRPRSRARPRAARRCPCTGAAGRRTARPATRTASQLARQQWLVGNGRQVLERAVGITWTLAASTPSDLDELAAPVRRVHDDRVDARRTAAAGPGLARAGLARQQVVGGQHDRPGAAAGSGRAHWTGEPLEVDDVGRGRAGGSGACRGRARPAWRRLARASRPRRAHGGRTLADRVAVGLREPRRKRTGS